MKSSGAHKDGHDHQKHDVRHHYLRLASDIKHRIMQQLLLLKSQKQSPLKFTRRPIPKSCSLQYKALHNMRLSLRKALVRGTREVNHFRTHLQAEHELPNLKTFIYTLNFLFSIAAGPLESGEA